MWKLGMMLRSSQKRNTDMGFSLQCTHHYFVFVRIFVPSPYTSAWEDKENAF
jgi:hypothetical protein